MADIRAPLNAIPQGLLDFFGIKSMGQNPIDLQQQIIPTLEMIDWYANFKDEYAVSATPANIVLPNSSGFFGITSWAPGTIPSPVPGGELWFVREFVVAATAMAAAVTNLEIAPAYQVGAFNGVHVLPFSRGGPTAGNAVLKGQRAACLQPFWLPTGATLGYTLLSGEGTSTPFSASLRVVRVKI